VRTYSLVRYLRKHRPQLRIIVDLDDLMSRRMSLLLQASQPLSPGYLTKRLPPFLLRIAMSRRFGRMIVRHEQVTLARVERDLARIADALVLLSAEDARIMIDQCGADCRARVEVIPPPSEPIAPIAPLKPPVRFVFIGSDALTQNRLTIDYLIDLWKRAKITKPLVFYGLWGRPIELPPEITAVGYVEDLKDVYDGHSVLLTPSLIGGGVKTKVLEAFAYGASVIGNAITFESMNIGDYPLQIDDEEDLVRLIRAPAEQMARFAAAAQAGVNYVAQFHDPQIFSQRWRELMAPEMESTVSLDHAVVPLETH
jgi:glycosyltransferase involved in cell wall biosynthesis